MSDRLSQTGPSRLKRRGLLRALGGTAGLTALGFCSSNTIGTAHAQSTQSGEFSTDFDYTDSPTNHGWTSRIGDEPVVGRDSILTGWEGIISRPQPLPSGTIRFVGVKNPETYFGLRLHFMASDISFGEGDNGAGPFSDADGFKIQVGQNRDAADYGNEILLNETFSDDSPDGTRLETIVEDHGGERFDLTIERPSPSAPITVTYTPYGDGEERSAEIEARTFTDSKYMLIHYDGPAIEIDAIEIRQDEDPVERYDENGDGQIDNRELLDALADYDGDAPREEASVNNRELLELLAEYTPQ